jgi:hypothetical protein
MGLCGGQEVNNNLWWRIGSTGLGPSEIAEAMNTLWLSVNSDSWLAAHPVLYTLERMLTQIYAEDWETMLSSPLETPVGDTGLINVPVDSAAQYRPVAAVLTLTQSLSYSGSVRPKKGYLAFGPLTNAQVDTNGAILPGGWGAGVFAEMLENLGQNMTDGGGIAEAIGIRVARPNGAGQRGWTRISSWIGRNYSSFRRSRTYGH